MALGTLASRPTKKRKMKKNSPPVFFLCAQMSAQQHAEEEVAGACGRGGGAEQDIGNTDRAVSSCEGEEMRASRHPAASHDDGEGLRYSLDDGIESIGFGWFQVGLLCVCGATQLADATELLVLSLLNAPVQCAFNVSKAETAWLASSVFAGMLCGAYVTGHVSDQFGRRAGFGMTSGLVGSFGLLSAVAPNFEALVATRFFVGMGVGGANAALSLFAEFLPTRLRGTGLIIFFFFFSVGGVLEAGLAWLIMPDWRRLLFVTAIPSVLLLLCVPLVPESPRFLLVQGREEEAQRVLAAAAACNRTQLPPGRLSQASRVQQPAAFSQILAEVQRLLKRGLLRRLTLRLWVIFFFMATLYYALVQLTVTMAIPAAMPGHECDTIPSQVYWHVLVMNAGELPGLVAASVLLDALGRKGTIAVLSLLTALLSLCLLAVDGGAGGAGSVGEAPHLVLVMFAARACALGLNQSLWIYTTEAYPTVHRALGIGSASWLVSVPSVMLSAPVTVFPRPSCVTGTALVADGYHRYWRRVSAHYSAMDFCCHSVRADSFSFFP